MKRNRLTLLSMIVFFFSAGLNVYAFVFKGHLFADNLIANNAFTILAFHVIAGIIAISIPYNYMRRAMKKAEKQNTIKTDFIINLSHELRTPVNIILSASKMMKCENMSLVHAIENSAYRLNKVCNNIIEFNEIEHTTCSSKYEKVNLEFLIDCIIEDAEYALTKNSLNITFSTKGDPYIVSDIKKLKSIIQNTLSNSIKYCNKNGEVNIILDTTSNPCSLTILNTGPPIPKDEAYNIFEKFYKVKSNDLPSTEGLGIGLYITKKLCSILGGNIEVVSIDSKSGFTLFIPNRLIENPETAPSESYYTYGFFYDI